jgi:glucokinase
MIEKFETNEENDNNDDNIENNLIRKKLKKKKEKNKSLKISFTIIIILLLLFLIIFIYKNFNSPQFYNVLIGDIGGTNIRLKILRMTKDIEIEPIIMKADYKSTFQFKSLEFLLRDFISELDNNQKPEVAVLGIPGPVEDNQLLTLPNIPHWDLVNGDELGEKLGIKKFIFLNDFVCNGYAVQTNLKENIDYIRLNNVTPIDGGPKLMIGPGTGLGMGFLLKNRKNKYYTIGSSEGGGQDFSAKSEFLLKLRSFIRDEVGLGNVSLGKICSGRSLIPIYKFLHLYGNEKHQTFEREPILGKKIDIFKQYKEVDKVGAINVEITTKGLSGECPLCRETLLLFIEIFAEIAGDLSLFTLPTNGVYLLGGITRIITPLILNNTIFMNHFRNKDHLWLLLQKFPIYLVQNKDIGLVGATEAARRILENI